MFESNLGNSFHADVFAATPEDDASRVRLVEEIKGRAKAEIKASNHRVAAKLYAKAIDTYLEVENKEKASSDIAILYANKSMCELSTKQSSEALSDANSAIKYDKTYAKGFYRKAAALIELKEYSNAKSVLEEGLAIQPGDKDFLAQLKKVEDLMSSSSTSISPSPSTTSSTKSTYVGSSSKSSSSSAPKSTATSTKDKNDDADDEKLGLARGYRKTADGKVTTFFNHELDEKTKELIGDIAPKKLDIPAEIVAKEIAAVGADSGSTSVWNSAGTYEERIFTPWAIDRLTALFTNLSIESDLGLEGIVKVTLKVEPIKGDAQISMLRGKRKHIYDFVVDLGITGKIGGVDSLEGSIHIEDVTADLEHEVTVTAKSSILSADAVRVVKKKIEGEVISVLKSFNSEFKLK